VVVMQTNCASGGEWGWGGVMSHRLELAQVISWWWGGQRHKVAAEQCEAALCL